MSRKMIKYKDPRTGIVYDKLPSRQWFPSGLHVKHAEIIEIKEEKKKKDRFIDEEKIEEKEEEVKKEQKQNKNKKSIFKKNKNKN